MHAEAGPETQSRVVVDLLNLPAEELYIDLFVSAMNLVDTLSSLMLVCLVPGSPKYFVMISNVCHEHFHLVRWLYSTLPFESIILYAFNVSRCKANQ